jgi:pimeloyl-ACP methyl ester carboxylesterase
MRQSRDARWVGRHRTTVIGMAVALMAAAIGSLLAQPAGPDDGDRVLTVDHYVRIRSGVPSVAGQSTQIYVRERVKAGTVLRATNLSDRVVVFVHGAGTPAEVAFDVPYQDYSWMGYLAEADFDVFSMDFTGYGRSTRPPVMDDPCNLADDQQAALIPGFLAAPCKPAYPHQLTNIGSEWSEIAAVVDYVRALRHVDRVSLIGWSLGGPRAGGFASRYPEKVQKLVLLAPAFNRTGTGAAPATLPANGVAFNKQSREDFFANWDRQVGCPDQYDPEAAGTVWAKMLESDPVGATWGPGVRRAPNTTVWGWNTDVVAKIQTPVLMVAGAHDKQVLPDRVRDLYNDWGAREKVFVDLGCASHNALWERNHLQLFRASREWLSKGSVNGSRDGMLRLGY